MSAASAAAMPIDWKQRLEEAHRHVRRAEANIERQTRIVEELRRDGHETVEAEALLATFRESLRLMSEHLAEEQRMALFDAS